MDEGFTGARADDARPQRDPNAMRGDLLPMDNRVLTATAGVRKVAARLDEAAADRVPA